jgi:6-phosphogluconolactonase (cycloisomerase 2 family)
MSIVQPLSRRHLLKGASALALGASLRTVGAALRPGRILAYASTYTGSVGNLGNGEGIYSFEMDTDTGELSDCRLVAKTPSPSWIVIHPSKRYLYAVNEQNSGSVSAFAIRGASGDLTPLNTVSSGGAEPAYISLDGSGRYAFVANYGGGSLAVLPVLPTGGLGTAVDLRRDQGSVGSMRATDAPRGSFAISGHDAPHVHMVLPDPQNRFVLATDLGQDRIYVYRFDTQTGRLSENAPYTALPTGDGPRHLAFHPNGHWLYSIQEESSTVAVFDYDAQSGSLHAKQTVSALPPDFAGTSFASEILVGPEGRFLYAANRLRDTVAVFSIGGDGRLQRIGEASTLGDYPGQCRIDPTGRFLYACNRRSDSITSFRIDRKTGLLSFTGRYAAVGSPGSITFLACEGLLLPQN